MEGRGRRLSLRIRFGQRHTRGCEAELVIVQAIAVADSWPAGACPVSLCRRCAPTSRNRTVNPYRRCSRPGGSVASLPLSRRVLRHRFLTSSGALAALLDRRGRADPGGTSMHRLLRCGMIGPCCLLACSSTLSSPEVTPTGASTYRLDRIELSGDLQALGAVDINDQGQLAGDALGISG